MRRTLKAALLVVLCAVCRVQAAPSTVTIGNVSKGNSAVEVVSQCAGGKWRAASPDAQAAKGASSWRLFTLSGEAAPLSASPIKADESGSLVAPLARRAPEQGVAVRGGSPRQPRHGQAVSDPAVVGAITELLRQKGIKVEKARVTQCVKVDLLGDGDPEWLVCAHSRDNIADAGITRKSTDYALAALVWVTPRGTRRASALHVEPLHLDAGQGSNDMGQFYRFAGVVDLEGRGAMCAALHSVYYEGGGLELWSFDGKQAKSITRGGWGL